MHSMGFIDTVRIAMINASNQTGTNKDAINIMVNLRRVELKDIFDRMSHLPEHLKSCSCSSAKLCPFNWLGEWHRVYGANRGELRKYRDNHDKWQSHVNGLSDNRNARMRGIPLKISRGNAVMLLLFKVLVERKMNMKTYLIVIVVVIIFGIGSNPLIHGV